jgi:hypothetical protein
VDKGRLLPIAGVKFALGNARGMKMEFTIERDEETGVFVASWDDPEGGGITTQAGSLSELSGAITEAVRCHFGDRATPRVATLHFQKDPELQLA